MKFNGFIYNYCSAHAHSTHNVKGYQLVGLWVVLIQPYIVFNQYETLVNIMQL